MGKISRANAVLIGVAVVVAAASGYLSFTYFKGEAPGVTGERGDTATQKRVEGTVAQLSERLARNPTDADGFSELGRSYAQLGRFGDAAAAYAKVAGLRPNDAQALADWADAQAMTQQGFDGEPEKLVTRALAADPNNPKALALAGAIAFGRNDPAGALRNWERMLSLIPPDAELARVLAADISEVRTRAGGSSTALKSLLPKGIAGSDNAPASAPAPAPGARLSLSGKVDLDPALKSRFSPEDAVFIFVRAAEGPRMPIAAMRKQLRDLPYAFSFDDTMAMSHEAKLSDVPKVVVVARLSKSGQPTLSPGDVEALSPPLEPTAKDVRLRLGQVPSVK